MREIKFRAWNKISKTMGEPFLLEESIRIRPAVDETDDCIFMQFTGIKDKNGREIYEGDIFGEYSFCGDYTNRDEPFGEVYFDEDLFAFCVKQTNGGWEYLNKVYQKPRVSIIGSIYEHPKLLTPHTVQWRR